MAEFTWLSGALGLLMDSLTSTTLAVYSCCRELWGRLGLLRHASVRPSYAFDSLRPGVYVATIETR
jgi:hypothetical protein